MTQVKMPEPVAWLRSDELQKLGEPYSDKLLNQKTDSMRLSAKGTEKAAKQYGHNIAVITTEQAEAYAKAVRDEAIKRAKPTYFSDGYLAGWNAARRTSLTQSAP